VLPDALPRSSGPPTRPMLVRRRHKSGLLAPCQRVQVMA